MDVILLRDLGPLAGQEWAYQWGTSCTLMNGAVMRLHKGSPAGRQLLQTLAGTPPKAESLDWGRGVYSRARALQPFGRLPTCFFNSAWMTHVDADDAEIAYMAGTGKVNPSRWFGAFA